MHDQHLSLLFAEVVAEAVEAVAQKHGTVVGVEAAEAAGDVVAVAVVVVAVAVGVVVARIPAMAWLIALAATLVIFAMDEMADKSPNFAVR